MFEVTHRRELLRSGLAVAAGFGVSACGIGGRDTPNTAATRTINHAMGKTVVPLKPRRIVTLDDTFTSAALAVDAQIVGYTTAEASDTSLPDYLGEVRKSTRAMPEWVGTLSDPNIEQIALLRPDVILSAKVRHEQLYAQLTSIAATVFSETTGATWKENLRLTARTLGKAQLAEEELGAYEQRAKTIGHNIRSSIGHSPRISIVRFAGEPTVRLYTRNSFPGIVCADTGLVGPNGQPTGTGIAVNLSQERITELDAEHIFLSVYPDSAGDAATSRSDFQSNPLWSRLTGRQHEVNDLTWMTAVGLHGAHAILDDIAGAFAVESAAG